MDQDRLKRLMFRAHHMGSNENDILFGGFAAKYLETLSSEQAERFEALIAENDSDLYNWVTGTTEVPALFDHDVMAMLKKFVKDEAAQI
jgi:antitoxin CptB